MRRRRSHAWTDGNQHDPGVTVLELVAYSLAATAAGAVAVAVAVARRRRCRDGR